MESGRDCGHLPHNLNEVIWRGRVCWPASKHLSVHSFMLADWNQLDGAPDKGGAYKVR